jgi:hypothetical protein
MEWNERECGEKRCEMKREERSERIRRDGEGLITIYSPLLP